MIGIIIGIVHVIRGISPRSSTNVNLYSIYMFFWRDERLVVVLIGSDRVVVGLAPYSFVRETHVRHCEQLQEALHSVFLLSVLLRSSSYICVLYPRFMCARACGVLFMIDTSFMHDMHVF